MIEISVFEIILCTWRVIQIPPKPKRKAARIIMFEISEIFVIVSWESPLDSSKNPDINGILIWLEILKKDNSLAPKVKKWRFSKIESITEKNSYLEFFLLLILIQNLHPKHY